MAFLDFDIREVFFLAVRLILAGAAAAIGWFVSLPIIHTVAYVIRRRSPPDWVVAWLRLGAAVLLAWLAFWYIPVGGGLGGGGSGGGKGPGVGPYQGGKDTGTSTQSGKDTGTGKGGNGSETGKVPPGKEVLTIDVLGGDAVKDGKFYLLNKKGPPVDWDHLKAHLEQTKTTWGEIRILLTGDSIFEDDIVVRRVREWATKNDIKRTVTRTTDVK